MTIAEARALIEENIRKQSDEDRISALETREVLLAMLDATEALVDGSIGSAVIPYIGENGNWWVGNTDTGQKPIAVLGGLKKGMTVMWDISQPVPDGCVLTHEHPGEIVDGVHIPEIINGVKIPRYARRVPVGFDPTSSPTPANVTAADAENYGAVGNTGGLSKYKLSIGQLPKHSFFTTTSTWINNTRIAAGSTLKRVFSSMRKNGNQDYDDVGSTGVPDLCPTNELGNGDWVDNRQEYVVTCYITKVSEGEDSDIASIDIQEGTGILIDKDDIKKPVISIDPDVVATKENGKVLLADLPLSVNPTATPTLGETFGGGKIFHILTPDETGYEVGKIKVLIAAPADANTGVRWSFQSLNSGGSYFYENEGNTLEAIGEGASNTTKLLAFLSTNTNPAATDVYAIKIAAEYTSGGFSDWYLPSKDELRLLSNLNKAGGALEGFLGTVQASGYWSSTENETLINTFYEELDSDGGNGSDDRSSLKAVRCVRVSEYGGGSDGLMLKSEADSLYLTKAEYSVGNAYSALPTVSTSANIEILIENAIFIKEINIFAVSGNPVVEIPELGTGLMGGQTFYPQTANLKKAANSTVGINVSEGEVKIQIVKFNV